ncbi:uncharacterized protein LOC111261983 isoform X2 [Varroa jacobsoni]|uniref:uncharacterized protein LOC111261983 isoform X2 n=1 Tax=Varroa jacobsoni TaxID=62625 RepID=UPI000BF769BD|nr:uncharacterized protein LOC111261983 isoform X2 [Varroa jacobsoni]
MTELFMYQLSPVPPGDSIGDKIGPLPRHGAITLDGNRRWGHSLGRHPGEGHVEAIEIIGWIARCMIYIGIKEMAVLILQTPADWILHRILHQVFGQWTSEGARTSTGYCLGRIAPQNIIDFKCQKESTVEAPKNHINPQFVFFKN